MHEQVNERAPRTLGYRDARPAQIVGFHGAGITR
jgi:hypothetical protein